MSGNSMRGGADYQPTPVSPFLAPDSLSELIALTKKAPGRHANARPFATSEYDELRPGRSQIGSGNACYRNQSALRE
jgi:hypothetical protein